MSVKVQLEQRVETPTTRETVVREALLGLPECNPDYVDGYAEMVAATERLKAAEQAREHAEELLRQASERIRRYVAANWKAKEISEVTRAVLTVW